MRDRYVLTQHNSVANAFGVYGLDMLVEIARYLGRTADVTKYKARGDALRASIDKHLWSAKAGAGWTSGGAYTDGLPCKNASVEEEGKTSPCAGSMKTKCFLCTSHAAFHSSVCACDHAATSLMVLVELKLTYGCSSELYLQTCLHWVPCLKTRWLPLTISSTPRFCQSPRATPSEQRGAT